jgi:hypothetical protein
VERAIPVKSAISAVWQKQKWTAIQDHSFALNDLYLQKLLQKEVRSDNIHDSDSVADTHTSMLIRASRSPTRHI